MTTSQQAGQVGELDWLLTSCVQKIPDVAHALTVSVDGLALAVSLGLSDARLGVALGLMALVGVFVLCVAPPTKAS